MEDVALVHEIILLLCPRRGEMIGRLLRYAMCLRVTADGEAPQKKTSKGISP